MDPMDRYKLDKEQDLIDQAEDRDRAAKNPANEGEVERLRAAERESGMTISEARAYLARRLRAWARNLPDTIPKELRALRVMDAAYDVALRASPPPAEAGMVPEQATVSMLDAGSVAAANIRGTMGEMCQAIWSAMLSAAPKDMDEGR